MSYCLCLVAEKTVENGGKFENRVRLCFVFLVHAFALADQCVFWFSLWCLGICSPFGAYSA